MALQQRIVTCVTQPVVYVLTTRPDATRTALTTAIPLARGARARLVLLVPHVVPYPLPVDRGAEAGAFIERRYQELLREEHGVAEIRVCLCRTPADVVHALPPASTVVVGGRSGSLWQSGDERLSRRLARLGHHAIFAASARAWPSAAAGGALAVLLSFIGVRPAVAGQSASQADAQTPVPPERAWDYGAFLDVGYLRDVNDPPNHLYRSRGTAFRVDEWDVNMAAAYVKKKPSEQSRWGTELLAQGGTDEEVFGFSATAPNLAGARWLGHLGLANVSYLVPVGTGLTVQGGIFASLVGYDSLYAKDNFNYTRPWGADFTPYLMTGVNASYAVNEKTTATAFLVNGYFHLADANSVPSSGAQVAYKASPQVTVKETILLGPHQANTATRFWRFLSDSIVERRGERLITALEYQISEEAVDVSGRPRAWWMSAQLPVHWTVRGPWSVSVRPEVAWDSRGRWTGSEQTVTAVTTTLEYRIPYRWANALVRLEHRFDDSRGAGGGFFSDGDVSPGVVSLKPTQQLLILGLIVTFDSPSRR